MGATLSAQAAPPYDTQSTLAAKLAADRPCLLAFLAPSCGLCASLAPSIAAVEQSGVACVARLDSSASQAWAPELLAYTVDAVPCFVLCRPGDGKSQGRVQASARAPAVAPALMGCSPPRCAAAPPAREQSLSCAYGPMARRRCTVQERAAHQPGDNGGGALGDGRGGGATAAAADQAAPRAATIAVGPRPQLLPQPCSTLLYHFLLALYLSVTHARHSHCR